MRTWRYIQARVVLTLFSVWLGWPHVVKIHGQVEMYMGSGEGLFIRPKGSFVFFFNLEEKFSKTKSEILVISLKNM
jgi:hypothetical protein